MVEPDRLVGRIDGDEHHACQLMADNLERPAKMGPYTNPFELAGQSLRGRQSRPVGDDELSKRGGETRMSWSLLFSARHAGRQID